MRVMLTAAMPTEPFNTLVRKGQAGQILGHIMEELKPEAAYFTELDGRRTAVLIIDLKNTNEIPRFAEPFFLKFEAECKFRIVMSAEDLQNAGLDALGKLWA